MGLDLFIRIPKLASFSDQRCRESGINIRFIAAPKSRDAPETMSYAE